MPILYVYEPFQDAFALSDPDDGAQMPHVRRFFFPVRDFLRGAHSEVCWTDARALAALDALSRVACAPYRVRAAFRRFPDLRRNAGLYFSLSSAEPEALRAACVCSGLFSYISPPYCGGADIGVCCRVEPCGETGVHVFAAQDMLLARGLFPGPLSGRLCAKTRRALSELTNAPPDATIGAAINSVALR